MQQDRRRTLDAAAGVAELADAQALGACALGRRGSNPLSRTCCREDSQAAPRLGDRAQPERPRCADRDLRLRRRRADRRPRGARPAAARAGPLRRRHRARPVRPAAASPRSAAFALDVMDDLVEPGRRSCSSSPATARSAAVPARRPRALRRPGRRGRSSPPYAGRSRPPATAGSASSAPRPPSPAAPTRTPSPPRRRSASPARPARASWTSSSAASPAATSCSALAHAYLDPLLAAGVDTVVLGCTHYPLLTGVISLRPRRRRHARLQRRGDREGRLPRARRPPTSCATTSAPEPAHRFLATGDPEPFGPLAPPLPRPGDRLGRRAPEAFA